MTHTSTPSTEAEVVRWSNVLWLLSWFLDYPREDWDSLALVRSEVLELESPAIREHLLSFLDYAEGRTVAELAENYVKTFDFQSSTALYFTYSTEGEERDRGVALVQLKKLYESVGLETTHEELPDYLPLFLEFASLAPPALLQQVLPTVREAMVRMQASLAAEGSPYEALLAVCLMVVDEILSEGGRS